MTKRIVFIVIGLVSLVGLSIFGNSFYWEHYPVPKEPSAEWEPYVSSLDVKREKYFVEIEGVKIEAELFIPNGGRDQKPAVVFSPGSGDSLYQNYSWGMVEDGILDVFLPRDMAVLLINKRGMGLSEGNWVKNTFEERAVDVYAAITSIQGHPSIDKENIGVVGHSQGGWIAVRAAAEYPDITFFISLAGPTMTVDEQGVDTNTHDGLCEGLEGDALLEYVEENESSRRFGQKLGRWTGFGMWGYDEGIARYDPREDIRAITVPGLFLFAENDDLVTPAINIERLDSIFSGDVPVNFQTAVVAKATHVFSMVDDVCDSWINPWDHKRSPELAEILEAWLEGQGY